MVEEFPGHLVGKLKVSQIALIEHLTQELNLDWERSLQSVNTG